MLSIGIDDGVYMVAETTRGWVEIYATEVITDGVELMTILGYCAGGTEIDRVPVSRENRIGLIDRVLLEQGRKQQFVFLYVVDLQVGGRVENLNAIRVSAVEQLTCGVG